MTRFVLALAIVSLGALASAQSFNFNFSEVASAKPFEMLSVNNRGDVFGYLQNTDGTKTGTVYNQSTGFQNVGLTASDLAISTFTQSGYIYSRDFASFDSSPIYRTAVNGTKSALDLTNGGALTFSTISKAVVGDDDRLLFTSNDQTYLWFQGGGSTLIGNGLGDVSFGNAGSIIVTGPTGVAKIAADGTRTDIVAPTATAGLGILANYKELASGTKVYQMFKTGTTVNGQITVTTDYIVPAGQTVGYAVTKQFEQSGFFSASSGKTVVGLNQDGFAATADASGRPLLNNQPAYDVFDRNGMLVNNVLIDAISGSESYIIGRGSAPGFGSNVNVLGTYTGTPATVPEPASLAVLGLGALGLLRRKRKG